MDSSHLVFIHLSDIHFRSIDPPFDLDEELRNQLELDAKAVKLTLDHVDGILITGDIAFGGSEDEYTIAKNWLEKLCHILGCNVEKVWVVPGNHDVFQPEIKNSKLLKLIHNDLRTVHEENIDKCLLDYLSDSDAQNIFFTPIKNYNTFAFKYGLAVLNHKDLFWNDDLFLNDGSILRLRGINSTLISDDTDNLTKKLIVSSYQTVFLVEDNVTYLTLCHHPPTWLKDCDNFEDCLNNRVSIQLFGHKHRQRLNRIDDSIRISAGACHPARNEKDWEPRYNFLAVKVSEIDKLRKLDIKIWPRVWSKDKRAFCPELHPSGKEYHSYLLPLKSWVCISRLAAPIEKININLDQQLMQNNETQINERGRTEIRRKLVYRLFSLPYHQIIEIAVKLELLKDEDKSTENIELFKRFIDRAESQDKFSSLWDIINDYSVEKIPNPYK